jgi:hypothetical protein
MSNWVITTSKNSVLLTSDNLKIIKFVQLLTSRYLTLFVGKANFVPKVRPSELSDKIKFVYDVVSAELDNIEKLSAQREQDNFHIKLIETTKEFLDIIDATDAVIEGAYNSEIDNLKIYKTYCANHKKFLFQKLFNADYLKSTVEIKEWVFNELNNYPHDSRYVSLDLNNLLINKFK